MDLLKYDGKKPFFPCIFFLDVVPTLFNDSPLKTATETPLYSYDEARGLHVFTFDGCVVHSDSAIELVEIAIREIERSVNALRARSTERPYVVLHLACPEDGPSIDFYDAFNVLERPYRVEFYTDSFRRGINKLAVSYGVNR